jgi:hypothetical protein
MVGIVAPERKGPCALQGALMDTGELIQALDAGEVVEVSDAEWSRLEERVTVTESHETGQAGLLLIVELEGRTAAVESPAPGRRVLRQLEGPAAVRRFVTDRLDTYERMWNGCGCKIDYYH